MRTILIFLGFIILVGSIGFIIYNHFARSPNAQTQEIAKTIQAYPNAKIWDIENHRSFCIVNDYKICTPSPVVIKFASSDSWPLIYQYYQTNMPNQAWTTKSEVLTSIPSSIVFTNDKFEDGRYCEITFGQASGSFLDSGQKTAVNDYQASIVCFPEKPKT